MSPRHANLPSSESPVSTEELSRIFNTSLVAALQDPSLEDSSEAIRRLMDTPAFAAILQAIQLSASSQGISERQSTEEMISIFRKLERAWTRYVFQEGITKMRGTSR